ncbi:MAG TPA: TetR/AcrR family transcriptional regulator C-terminal domain-containing protein [Stellaceae bacterium]|jgi:AcrR family transcriptional regulator|nr:TetR/AcrR family transcriptional regulator C-terminal domain-containing protein [Stellaceae bacterium]
MPLGSIDRRVARTRTLLHNALLASLRNKSYDAITVEDLCIKAKIGRSTFYAHYTGKDDLLRARLTHLRDTLIERRRAVAIGQAPRQGLVFSGIMFEHAYEHVHLHRHLLGNRGGSIAFAMVEGMLSELVREEIAPAARATKGDALIEDFTIAYIVGAFMSVMDWWIKQGMALPPQRIDALFQRAVAEGVAVASRS